MKWKCPECGIEKIGDPEAIMAVCEACQVEMYKLNKEVEYGAS